MHPNEWFVKPSFDFLQAVVGKRIQRRFYHAKLVQEHDADLRPGLNVVAVGFWRVHIDADA